MHGNAHQARRGPGQRAGETLAQPPGVLAMTANVGRGCGSRLGVDAMSVHRRYVGVQRKTGKRENKSDWFIFYVHNIIIIR